MLKYGYMDLVRTIHMNAQHPKAIVPSLAGHSTGKWEGDTLVVDTIGFAPGVLMTANGLMHSAHDACRGALHARSRGEHHHAESYQAQDPLYWKTDYSGFDSLSLSKEEYVSYGCKELSGKNNQRPK